MTAIRSPDIWHRDDFAVMANWRRYTRVIEVGVDRGEFAQCFLSRWVAGDLYLAVDTWKPYGEMQWDRTGDLLMCAQRLTPWARHAKIVKASSLEAREYIRNADTEHYRKPYDLIYIDDDHTYERVRDNLTVWWDLVSEIGMLAGHDYGNDLCPGVQQAVDEFAVKHGLTVYVTPDYPSSWYVYKSGMPTGPRIKPEEVF